MNYRRHGDRILLFIDERSAESFTRFAIALAMGAQLTDDAAKYSLFLTPEYAQFASCERLPMRLVTPIPPEAETILKDFVKN